MRATKLWLTGVPLAVGLFIVGALLGGSTPASAVPFCSGTCTCSSSCDTYCTYIIIIGGEPETVETTCGEWGTCVSSSNCNGCTNLSCTTSIYGDSGNNTLNGTSARECIYGYDGNDTIDGNAGDDRIYAGNGTDTAYGDSGNDCLWGEGGDDHLDGESGWDFADGGAGSDTCTAEAKVSCP